MLQNNKDLLRIMDRLIQNDGYKDYSSLTKADKESVTAFCITEMLDTVEMDYFFGDELRTISTDLVKYMGSGEICRAIELAENLKKAAIKYFDNILIEIFQDRISYFNIQENIEDGLTSFIDTQTGETLWMK